MALPVGCGNIVGSSNVMPQYEMINALIFSKEELHVALSPPEKA